MSSPSTDPVERQATPRPPEPGSNAAAATTPAARTRPAVPSAIFLEQAALANQQQQRASMSSLMFMTFFFFMMSGGSPPMGMDEIEQKRHDLDNFGNAVSQLQLYLNGSQSNYSFSPSPIPSGLTLLPPYLHREHPSKTIPVEDDSVFSPHYFQNVTGFYREADAHYLNLTDPSSSNSSHHFFRHLEATHRGSEPHTIGPLVNQTSYNETQATRKRGDFDWAGVTSWSININEKEVVARDVDGSIIVKEHERGKHGSKEQQDSFDDWAWVHVSGMTFSNSDKTSVLDYQLAGVHQRSTGEYTLLGMPAGQGIDIRLLLSLLPDRHARNLTGKMVLFEMQRHLARLRADPTLGGGSGSSNSDDDEAPSHDPACPIQVHLRLLPVPFPYSAQMLKEYEREMREPTGIYVQQPPNGIQIEGVAIFDECGVAYGLTGGQGIAADAFWHKSIHYAAYAAIANLIILFCFVWEMEATRTPSALAKISFWSMILMVGADAWLFSAHAVVAIMSDNVTTLPLLLPSFLCLCTALVFGPRFIVILHRVQAPESPSTPARTAPERPANAEGGVNNTPGTNDAETTGSPMSRLEALQSEINRHPQLRWLTLMLFCTFLMFIGVIPQVVPLLLVVLYSFWVPQIWRNARRGNRKSLTWRFVLGMSTARLALPLYAFGCPDNVFFVETNSSIWLLPIYVWAQVLVLWVQERFGASFFLPQRFAPPPPYDYHQPLPIGDSESGQQDFGNCSICMEPILVNQIGGSHNSDNKQSLDDKSALASTATNMGAVGSRVMNINFRRTYALAPCHHLFHTDCLSQWMAIKNTCPLCKRGLPPL